MICWSPNKRLAVGIFQGQFMSPFTTVPKTRHLCIPLHSPLLAGGEWDRTGSWGLWWVEMEVEVEVEMDLPGPWELQEPSGAAERGETHLLCKCLLEPGVDSGKLLNYFKQRTKVLSLPLSSWILVKTKQNRNLGVNHLTMISAPFA